jgi:hypothetical protein
VTPESLAKKEIEKEKHLKFWAGRDLACGELQQERGEKMSTAAPGAAPAAKVQALKVGSRVEVPEKGRGTVRFMGAVKFSSKDNWVGIELDVPSTPPSSSFSPF